MESLCSRPVKWLALGNSLTLLLLLVSRRASCAPDVCDFPAIFNFGDSNSDTGGLSAAFGQVPSPNGQTFFHSPAGRYSDGRLIIDFAAESLGKPFLSPFLDSLGSNFTHGANFATAGATVRPPNQTQAQSGQSPVSLNVQSTQFADFQRRSQIVRKQGAFRQLLPAEDVFGRALYTLDIGQNDLTGCFKLNMSVEQVKATVPDVVAQLSRDVKHVYGLGGRTFWVHNTGPLGCLAYSLDRFHVTPAQTDKFGCAIPMNEAAQFYNRKLREAVVQLRKDMPRASITYVDVYSVKYQLITQANTYGFEEPLVACCGVGGKYNFDGAHRCGAKITENGREIVVGSCKNPTVKISWDGIHYTDAANKWVFEQIVSGKFSDPSVSLKLACRRVGGRQRFF